MKALCSHSSFFLLFICFFIVTQAQDTGTVVADTAQARAYMEGTDTLILQGKYDAALLEAEKALAIFRIFPGPGSVPCAEALLRKSTAMVWQENKEDEALVILDSALSNVTGVLAEEHPLIADLIYQRGLAFSRNNDQEQALAEVGRSLELRKKYRGDAHVDVAESFYGLGMIHYRRSRFDEALENSLKSLERYSAAYPPNHPSVLRSLNNVAGCLYSLGKYDMGIDSARKAYEIWDSIYAGTHPDQGYAAFQLANCFFKKQYLPQAIQWYKTTETIWTNTFGPDHRGLALISNNLGACYSSFGASDAALEAYEKGLEIMKTHVEPDHFSLAIFYANIGGIHYGKGEYRKADSLVQKALELRLKGLPADHSDIGDSYAFLGTNYTSMKEFDLAEEYFFKALDQYLKTLSPTHPTIGGVYAALGGNEIARGNFLRAEEYYEKAYNIYLDAYQSDDHPDFALLYTNQGIIRERTGEPDQAVALFQKAKTIYEKHYGPFYSGLIMVYSHLSNVEYNRGNFYQAIEHYKFNEGLCRLTKNEKSSVMGETYNSLGNCYTMIRDYPKAYEYYGKALEIFEALPGDRRQNIALVYQGLGYYFINLGDLDQAQSHYQTALDLFQQIYPPGHIELARAYMNFGIGYFSQGAFEKAKVNFEKSRVISEDQETVDEQILGLAYNNLANVDVMQESFDDAFVNIGKAVSLLREAHSEDHLVLALAYNNVGFILNKVGRHEEALANLDTALMIYTRNFGPEYPDIGVVYMNYALVHLDRQEWEEGEKAIRQALEYFHYRGSDSLGQAYRIQGVYQMLGIYGNILLSGYRDTGDEKVLYRARQIFGEAINALNYQFTALDREVARRVVVDEATGIYEGAIKTSLLLKEATDSLQFWEEAFTLSERSKAFILYSAILEANARQFAGIPAKLLEEELQLRTRISLLKTQRYEQAALAYENRDSLLQYYNAQLFRAEGEYLAFKKQLELDYPDYYRLKYNFETVSLGYVRNTLLSTGQSLLEYFVGDSSIFIFTVDKLDIRVTEVEKDPFLKDMVESMREGIYGYYSGNVKVTSREVRYGRKYVESATKLFELLLKPVANHIKDTLVLIPDGILGYLPFEALVIQKADDLLMFEDYTYFLDKYQVSYCYSATLLREMEGKSYTYDPDSIFLGLAPYYQPDTIDVALRDQGQIGGGQLSKGNPLAHSGEEVLQARDLMGGAAYLGPEATRALFRNLAGYYRILHLATHGRANDEIGEFSYLAFTRLREGLENEYLYVRDLYDLRLFADLVVLSACETGIGELRRGEGIISMARAFAYAGAKTIVTTLWRVNDEAGKDLSCSFYKALGRGAVKDAALREAKLQVRNSPETAHPYFWAGYIFVGDRN